MNKCEKLESFSKLEKCVFCDSSVYDELKYGAVYKYEDLVVHYFCLLLSSSMEQNGEDEDGIYGFLPNDIRKEVKRGKKLRCTVCRKTGATLGCSVAKCKAVFHLPCGISKGSLHQFYGQFKSFCITHRPRQRISNDVLKRAVLEPATCVICYDDVILNDDSTMWAPCCKKNAFFHRICVQKLANSFGGYAFRCPLCNDQHMFTKAMKDFGIFVPDRDASWEQEENAFNELLYRHNRCDAQKCICPHGRNYNKKASRWFIILCQLCGSQGIHHACRIQKTPDWQCDSCLTMLHNAEKGSGSDNENETDTLLTSTSSIPVRTSSLPVHRNSHFDASLRRSVPSCSRSTSGVTAAEFESGRRTVKKDKIVQLPHSPSSTSSSESKSRSRSRSSSKSSSRSASGSPVLVTRTEKRKSKISEVTYVRSRSTTPSSRRRSSSSSSSVISVTRAISPIIVTDSDDDVEVVADISRNVVISREGNKIQIISIMPEVKPDKVEIQGDVNVRDVQLECGVRMTDVPIKCESIFKRRKTVTSSTCVTPENTTTVVDNSNMILKNSNSNISRLSSPLAVSPASSQQYNYDVAHHNRNAINTTTIDVSSRNLSSSQQPHTNIARNNVNSFTFNVNSEPEKKYQVYTPPNRGNLQIKTMGSVSPDIFSKVPRQTIIKIRDQECKGTKTSQVGKSHANSTTTVLDATRIDADFFSSQLQCPPNVVSSDKSSFQHEFPNGKCPFTWEQSKLWAKQQARDWESNFKSRYNHFGLKNLSVVLTPIMIKVMKCGTVKVVQKKLKNHVSNPKRVARFECVPRSANTCTTVSHQNNSSNSSANDKIMRTLLNKVVSNRSNLLLKSVYNNMAIKSKEFSFNNNDNHCDVDRTTIADYNGYAQNKTKNFKRSRKSESGISKQRKVDEIFRSLFAKQRFPRPADSKFAKKKSIKRNSSQSSINENNAMPPKKRRKTSNSKLNDCLKDKSNFILNNAEKEKKSSAAHFFSLDKNNLSKQNIVACTSHNENSQTCILKTDVKDHPKMMKQATLFDIFNSKSALQSKKDNCIDTTEKSPLRKRKILNYNHNQSYKRVCIKTRIDRLRSLQFVDIKRPELSSAELICSSCKSNIMHDTYFKKLCCFLNYKSFYKVHNRAGVPVQDLNIKEALQSALPSLTDGIKPAVNNTLFVKENKKNDPGDNFICVRNVTLLSLNKDINSSLNSDSTVENPDVSNFYTSLELAAAVNFPCSELNSLHSPNCLKYTSYPLSKILVDKILSSLVKIEIKKSLLTDNKDCYQFFIFINDLPVLIIKVRLDEIVKSQTIPLLNKLAEPNCSHLTVFNKKGIFESFLTQSDTPSSTAEKCICYSFENDVSNSLTEPVTDDVKNYDSTDSFFILPSLISFSALDVTLNNVCMKLLMTVEKNDKKHLSPKNVTFKMKPKIENDKNTNIKRPKVYRLFGARRRRRRKLKKDSISPCDGIKSELEITVPEENVLRELQNAIVTDNCSSNSEEPEQKCSKENCFETFESNECFKIKVEKKESDDVILKDDVSLNEIEDAQFIKSESTSIAKDNFDVIMKKRVVKSPKKLYMSSISHNDENQSLGPLDEFSGTFGFNIKEYEEVFKKNVYKYINTNNNCSSSNGGNIDGDCELFNYISKVVDNYIKTVIGSDFKPSLIERMIMSLKNG